MPVFSSRVPVGLNAGSEMCWVVFVTCLVLSRGRGSGPTRSTLKLMAVYSDEHSSPFAIDSALSKHLFPEV